MAGSLNRATLIGNVGADPEIRSLNNGSKVASIRLATSESWRDKTSGEKREKTEWHSVSVFNDGIIGVIEKYVKKGSKILIEGQLQTRKWQDQAGNDRYTTEIVLSGFNGNLLLLSGGGGAGGESAGRSSGAETTERRAQETRSFAKDIDDEIPF